MTEADYQAAADKLGVPVAAVKAVAEVESSGQTMWMIAGRPRPPIRVEAHWFGKLTGYRFNETHPEISAHKWTPSLAASTHAGAWAQFDLAASLDESAAIQATSWGAFQIMGFHWQALGYDSPQAMRDAMNTEAGQLDAFVRFIQSNPPILDAIRRQDWEAFASRYNGPGAVDVYAPKIAAAFYRHEVVA